MASSASMERSHLPSTPKITVPPSFTADPAAIHEWKYESRRVAQNVIDNVWLGPLSASRDVQFLTNSNIQLIISIATPLSEKLLNPRSLAPNCRFLSLVCCEPCDWLHIFRSAFIAIQEANARGVATLVYCESGNERSAACVAAYVMQTQGWDMIKAVQFVQCKRFSIMIDDGAKFSLQNYEAILRAQLQVAKAVNDDGISPRRSTRRSFGQLSADEGISSERRGMAPFTGD